MKLKYYIPGLVLEYGSLDALTERVKSAVPELLALNGGMGQEASSSPISDEG